MSTVIQKSYAAPQVDEREIMRYLGVRQPDETLRSLVGDCVREALPHLTYKACLLRTPLEVDEGEGRVSLCGILQLTSRSLAKALRGCDEALLLAATVGLGIDRLTARYGSIAPSRALVLSAVGTERIEALCDAICEELEADGRETSMRFSPGYGDLDLACQRELVAALECGKRIGLTLNESLLMSPSKSVTAIVGLKRRA